MSEVVYFALGTSIMVGMMVTIILFVVRFQRKLAARNKAYQEIEQLVNRQELQSAYAILEGQETERKRIAAELHDNIGGLVATLKIYSDLAVPAADLSEIHRLNLKMNELTESLGQEVRKLSHELDLRTLSGFGLKIALEQLSEAITSAGRLQVRNTIKLAAGMEDQVAFNLYRIVQELLTNTLKHAQASQASVEIVAAEQEITLIYEDNGRGFNAGDPSKDGMGLKNIRARAAQIHGKLTIDSSTKGSTFIIEIEPNAGH